MRAPAVVVASVVLTAGCSAGDGPASTPQTVDMQAPRSTGAATDAPEPGPTSKAPMLPDPPGAVRFDATVEVSHPQGGTARMVFRGVTLHRADGSPVVATYATNVLWDALDKKRVHVLAEPYQPEGRSIAGEHMRVLELSLASGEQSTVTGFSRRMKLRGSFRKTTGAKGTKREGETFIELVADGRTFEVFGYQADLPLEEPLEIEARAVSLSPTSAHAGGPFVYVESTTKP